MFRTSRLNLLGLLALIALAPLAGCSKDAGATSTAPEDHSQMKVLVIGMDGLDPVLLKKLMDAGKMPHFAALAARGTFSPLETAMPPQSPVAWSNFISGARPDVHMIWDFIHREPAPTDSKLPIKPFQSTGDTRPIHVPWYKEHLAPKFIPWFGGTRLPVYSESAPVSFRRGPAFWEELVAHDVDTTIYRIPANYPPPVKVKGHGEFRCLCGMGTPDMRGTYGEFTAFRTDIPADRSVAGGMIRHITLENNHAASVIEGPENIFHRPADEDEHSPNMKVAVDFAVDPEAQTVKITVDKHVVILKKDDWSDWIEVKLDTELPLLNSHFAPSALVRFRANRIGENVLDVYASPLQIDPSNPVNAISTPPEFAGEIAKATGPYYTAGIPEDTKALRSRPQELNEDQFLEMVHNLDTERRKQYRYALSQFKRGFLFYYFGTTDQLAHIFWRDIDPGHPGRLPEQKGKYDKVIENTYIEMDGVVKEALDVLDENDVLIIMSDHGFASFRRGFNVNTWLQHNGYQQWFGTRSRDRAAGLLNIDFENSQAYAVGINSLYINLRGRESKGIVPPEQYNGLLHEIGDKLLAYRDTDGAQPIVRIYYVREEFPDLTDEQMKYAPDMLIGYNRNYRGSWATALGGMHAKIVEDNKDRWSGDHCIAHYLVPGSLVTNLKINVDDPALTDLGPAILGLWNIKPPKQMIGRQIFVKPTPAAQ